MRAHYSVDCWPSVDIQDQCVFRNKCGQALVFLWYRNYTDIVIEKVCTYIVCVCEDMDEQKDMEKEDSPQYDTHYTHW